MINRMNRLPSRWKISLCPLWTGRRKPRSSPEPSNSPVFAYATRKDSLGGIRTQERLTGLAIGSSYNENHILLPLSGLL